MNTTPKAFITYSHKNAAKRERFGTFLAVMANKGEIEIWCDAEILAGDKWEPEIAEKLKESDILLYLVSADSLASVNCNKELTAVVEAFNIPVVPIVLDACDFDAHSLAEFEALPIKNKVITPVSRWGNHSDAWQNVVDGIRKKIASIPCKPIQGEPDTPSSTSKEPQPASSIREQEVADLFNRANFFLMLGNNDLAIANYSKAIELDQHHTEAYINRGISKEAKYDNSRPVMYNNRGNTYNEMKKHDLALADCNKAIELDPNFAEAYNNRGNAYYGKDDYDLAIADFNKAIELKPNLAEVHNNRGNAYDSKGDNDLAIVDYNKAIKLKPNYAFAYNNRGNTYRNKGDYDIAIADLNRAIKLNPNYVEAYANRSMTKTILKDNQGAQEDLETAIRLAEQQGNKPFAVEIQKKINEFLAEPK